jgi:hypothetical protein
MKFTGKYIVLISVFVFLITVVSWAQTVLIDEDFENGIFPAGWSQFTLSTDGGWNCGDSISLSSQYFTIPQHGNIIATNDNACQCNKQSDFLFTPYLDLSSYNTIFLSFDFYFEGEKNWGLGAEFNSEKATVEVSVDSGETFVVIDSLDGLKYSWQTKELNLSSFAGYPSVIITFKYNDYSYISGYQAYGWALDNVLVYEPVSKDMELISINNPVYSLTGTNYFSATVRNIGADTVFSFDANYRINDSTVITSVITGNVVYPFDFADITHSVPLMANPGIDTVYFWISNVNGQGADDNPSNDSLFKIISFVPYNAQRKILVEDFTSANCTGCQQVNAWLNPLLDSNADKIVQLRYHGLNDEMYLYNTDENDARTAFYEISSFPSDFGDGVVPVQNQADIDSLLAIPALYQIQLNAIYNDTSVNISVHTFSFADFISGNLSVMVALSENIWYAEPPGINEEFYFPFVMRKMFPDANGSDIGKPVIGQQNDFNFSFPMDTIFKADSLYAIAFVQDKYSKRVFQSAIAELLPQDTTSLPEIYTENDFLIFPQPASMVVNIQINTSEKISEIKILDITGRITYSGVIENSGGMKYISIDVSNFSPGLYLVVLDGSVMRTKIISVSAH